jgi:uncharacterized ferritin-like protein (DUF455 family)
VELRELAERIVLSESLEQKLLPPGRELSDRDPGPPHRPTHPGRPAELRFEGRRGPALPGFHAWGDPRQRAIVHHILANHELQALEVMAWALLAFPEAPPDFRSGLVGVLRDEQRHTRMHMERAASLGVAFGERPVNGYIWKKAMQFTSVLDYLAGLPLVFENRNLDHSLELAEAFDRAGDERSAAVLRAIHHDEIRHVAFGIEWLRRLKPDGADDWQTFVSHLHWPLRPPKARGDAFQREARLAAGLSPDFVDRLAAANDEPEAESPAG